MSVEFIVLSHDASSNALGRAQSLALVAQQIGRTELWAAAPDGWWKGAAQFDTQNVAISARGAELERELRRFRTPGARIVIWVTKGVHPLPEWLERLQRSAPDSLTLLDIDDDDAGLAVEYRRGSLLRAMKLNRLRRGHPARIRAAQRALWDRVDALTYASEAVRSTYPAWTGPAAWVPHVRADVGGDRLPRPLGATIRVGAFGTIRPHKGQQLLLDLIRSHRDLEVHAFRDSGLGTPRAEDLNWIELEPDTPLTRAYDGIDAVLLPMARGSRSSDVQFPAKLVDAMRAGVAIVASPTSAVREIAEGAFVPLSDTPTAAEARQAVYEALDRKVGERARQIYERSLTPGTVSQRVADVIRQLDTRSVADE